MDGRGGGQQACKGDERAEAWLGREERDMGVLLESALQVLCKQALNVVEVRRRAGRFCVG